MVNSIQLGQKVSYKFNYDPSILYPILRQKSRKKSGYSNKYFGYDIWNCYELSWLDSKGKPCIATLQVIIPSNSDSIIESKSLKMYLNSFNNHIFNSIDDVYDTIVCDLSRTINLDIQLKIFKNLNYISSANKIYRRIQIDDLDDNAIYLNDNLQTPTPSILRSACEHEIISETLYSELFRSICPVTGQPDFATLQIQYEGPKIDRTSLIRYIISYRNHGSFHEDCVENIFMDLLDVFFCKKLTVYAKFTRRGGIDINPIRSTEEIEVIKIIEGVM